MKLYIKYMVSRRCKMMVQSELENLGINHAFIELGVIDIPGHISVQQRKRLAERLDKSGLELMDDKRAILVERIKNVITEMIHYNKEKPSLNYSDYISEKLGNDYTYLANVFSEVKGITIQQYIILHKIERVKELLLYDEMSLKEISYLMHYSSVAHLSKQFKKITGLTTTFYRKIAEKRRRNLEDM